MLRLISRSQLQRFFASKLPKHKLLTLPSLSPTMEQGAISKWHKKIGDGIISGDNIAEIETDKTTMPMEADEESFLAKILIEPSPKKIKVGTPIAVLVESAEHVSAFKDFDPSQQQEEAQAAKAEPPKPQKQYPPHKPITLPSLSPTMEQGKIAKWLKKEGDEVIPGDNLVEIETDKTTMPMETDEEGFIAKILTQAGPDVLKVGTQIAIIVKDKSIIPEFSDFTVQKPQQRAQAPSQPQKETVAKPQQAAASQQQVKVQQPKSQEAPVFKAPKSASSKHVKISPRARTLADILDLDYSNLQGTGPEGRILEQDIKKILKAGGGRPSFEDKPNSTIRQVIARRLLESKTTIPHYYISLDINVDKLLKLRAQLNEKSKSKISVNDFLIKAAAVSMRHTPEVNSYWLGEYSRFNNQVDVCFACQTPRGLITPIVTAAEKKGLEQIAAEAKDLANRAREGTLQSHEFQGGTFTISNLGMFGIKNFQAIINPPQSAILAVGKAEERCVPEKGEVRIKNMMSVTMSCDHRSVDGAVGAQWLQFFKDYIENPEYLLL